MQEDSRQLARQKSWQLSLEVGWCRLTVLTRCAKRLRYRRLKVEYHKLLSTVAFKLNLRRFIEEAAKMRSTQEAALRANQQAVEAGAYTRPLFSST
jgi:hypothetical protein